MARAIPAQVQNEKLVEERREAIIAAAIRVFRDKGFHVATTRDVAIAAGVTQSNLYNYVKTKDDILYLVCEHLIGLYTRGLDQATATHQDPYLRLVEGLRAAIAVMSKHKDELQLLYHEAHSLPKRDRRLVLGTISRFIERFQDLLVAYESRYGATRLGDRRLAANLLSFVPAVVALRAWDLAKHAKQAELERGILDFVLAGLGVSPPSGVSGSPGRMASGRRLATVGATTDERAAKAATNRRKQ
jgi:AcrR family transcriptional regulator